MLFRSREINEISVLPEMKALLEPDGMLPLAISPTTFSARLQQELGQWKQVAESQKIVAE